MKHMTGSLMVAAMVFVLGCQENSTNPLNTTTGSSTSKLGGDVIVLKGEVLLNTRDAVDGSWMISGQAAYTMTPTDEGTITVDISVIGSLTPTYVIGNVGPISGQSSDLIQVPSSQPVFLDKEYIFDCGDGLEVLHLRYAVSEVSVSIDGMWAMPFDFGGISSR